MSTNRSLCSTSRIAWRSAWLSARGWAGPGAGPAPAAAVAGSAGAAGSSRPARRRPPGRRRARRPRGASSAIAVSVTASTSARCPRSRRASPRARAVLPAHPPRSGPWPAPAPVAASRPPGGRSARPRVAPLTAARRGQPGQRAGVAGPPPLHDVAGVQALPAQQRALLPIRGGVVGGQDLQLVLRGERPPPGPLGHLRIGTFRSSSRHPTRIFDPGRSDQRGHLARHLGEALHPRPRVTNCQGAGASTQVDREG